MGSNYKMPTYEQYQELKDGTYSTWTTLKDETGLNVNGRKFTSKFNPNTYIFLPAGGMWNENTHSGKGTSCYYWTTKWESSNTVYCISSTSSNIKLNTPAYPHWGASVRGVR